MIDPFLEHLGEKNTYILEKARELKSQGLLQKSIDLIEIFIQKDAKNHRLYFEFSLFLYGSCLFKQSLQIAKLTQSLLGVDSAKLFHLLGDNFLKLGDMTNSIESYIKCLELNPTNEAAAINASALLGMQGEVQKSIDILQSFLLLDPKSYDASLNLANLRYLKKDFNLARDLYVSCLKRNKENKIVLINLCECLRSLCDWDLLSKYEEKVKQLTFSNIQEGVVALEPPLHHLFRCCNPRESFQIASSILSSYPVNLEPFQKKKSC